MYTHTQEVHNFTAAEIILPYLLKNIHFESVIDIGCGTGTWLKVAKDLGIKE
jgi:ribosomal protein L11 methylase PrmA